MSATTRRNLVKKAQQLLIFAAAACLIYIVVGFDHSRKGQVCQGLDITVEEGADTTFANINDVRGLLVAADIFPEGQHLDSISLAHMEQVLTASPYISGTLCYTTTEGKVAIHVSTRRALMHIITPDGQDFYIDSIGHHMPRGRHMADLPLLTGHISAATAGEHYAPMAVAIMADSLWRSELSQLYVRADGIIEATPRHGSFTIELGDTAAIADKLARLTTFCKQALPVTGWDTYDRISVNFNGQVVAHRRRKR